VQPAAGDVGNAGPAEIVETVEELSPTLQAEVRELAAAVAARDGSPPLSDQGLVHLAGRATHVLARRGATLVGYGQFLGSEAELVALGSLRSLQGGEIAALLGPIEDAAAGDLLVWAHGRRSPVGAALDARGYARVRELWQLRRPLRDLPPAQAPTGIDIRGFRPGQDEDAWLAVNAAAFASHPEQGQWTRADLEARERERWFDPAGLIMAWDGERLLGSHWTKVHPDTDAAAAAHGALGEVYVLAVAPDAQGRHLGSALLWAGLHRLADVGCTDVLLYVDGDNLPAMTLYERAGFSRYDLDVQFRRR
jgi:mycothiol synthase